MSADLPIVIAFDGDCMMCSRTIRWIAERDHEERIRFTRLQDPLGQAMMADSNTVPMDSMLVRQGDQIHARSAAILTVLNTLGSGWKWLAAIGRWVPGSLRDGLYDFIAARRYQWFGKDNNCSLPSEALKRRLL